MVALAALANLAVAAAGGDGDDGGRSQIFYDTTQYPLACSQAGAAANTEDTRYTRVVSNPSEKHTKNCGRCFGGAFTMRLE